MMSSKNEIRLRSKYLLKTNKKEIRIKFIDAVLISLFPTFNRYFHIERAISSSHLLVQSQQ